MYSRCSSSALGFDAGFRSGWAVVTGPRQHARSYLEGMTILANMRLCANVPSQWAIQTALSSAHGIDDLVLPGGRLLGQIPDGGAGQWNPATHNGTRQTALQR